jgi:hypothetical protein
MKPKTARELLDDLAENWPLPFEIAIRVEKVLALHLPGLHRDDHCPVCDEFDYPCATLRILNGESE